MSTKSIASGARATRVRCLDVVTVFVHDDASAINIIFLRGENLAANDGELLQQLVSTNARLHLGGLKCVQEVVTVGQSL